MLIKLMLGLQAFNKKPFVGMKDLFEQLSSKQNPDTLFITCSDSRIVPSLITQADPGDLFSIRNIGNIIPPYPSVESGQIPSNYSEIAAIEFALKALDIKDIIICGHSHCGAMKGLLNPHTEENLPAVASWLKHSHSVLNEVESERATGLINAKNELEIATKKNILQQMEHLKTYPLVIEKQERNELTIHGWYYELETGKVFIYEPNLKDFISLELALQRALESRKDKIISNLCMHHLQQMLPVKSEKEYSQLMDLINTLQENILPIWKSIKEAAKDQLWKELGGFYTSHDDEQFRAMVKSSTAIKLTGLEEFRKTISIAPLSPLLNASIFNKQSVETQGQTNLTANTL